MPETDETAFQKIPRSEADAEINSIHSDGKDTDEAKQLSSGRSADELRTEAQESEHNRTEIFKAHFNRITIVALYGMAIGVFAFAVTWSAHVILPETYHWLNANQVEEIQNIFTGGVLAGLIADQFRKKMK